MIDQLLEVAKQSSRAASSEQAIRTGQSRWRCSRRTPGGWYHNSPTRLFGEIGSPALQRHESPFTVTCRCCTVTVLY
jgi:hypothetical protein